MEGSSRNDPQLLDLIPTGREWGVNRGHEQRSHGCSEERKLELRLAPPGEDWSMRGNNRKTIGGGRRDESLLSLGCFSSMNGNQNQTQKLSSAENPWGGSKVADQSAAEKKKAFSQAPANTAVPNTSQKRTAPAPVVGWPPIRSFRKNLAPSSSSSKPAPEPSQNDVSNNVCTEKPVQSCKNGFFVKINMDGVPIGRKVDLKAYDSYEKLSVAVDELFRDLLAAQRDSSAGGIKNKEEEEKPITGVLDGSGEYTLVYEDNEGDRMLAGDVPWHMFVSTVKRLRVLKSSELAALALGSKNRKIGVDSA